VPKTQLDENSGERLHRIYKGRFLPSPWFSSSISIVPAEDHKWPSGAFRYSRNFYHIAELTRFNEFMKSLATIEESEVFIQKEREFTIQVEKVRTKMTFCSQSLICPVLAC
jgi:hypothetical protein